jgi:Fic family protein
MGYIRRMDATRTWIWQHPDWPALRYDASALAPRLANAARAIGRLHGRVAMLHGEDRDRAALAALTEDVLKSSAIEGELLNVDAVRSSLARRLGVEAGGQARVDRHVDGVVEMTLDATRNAAAPLTTERLQAWQAALFPTGRSGLVEIEVGRWRDDRDGPMQVVSGPIGRQRVHFQAPPADRLDAEMSRFLAWCETPTDTPALLKAGLAHLWFVTVHPFEDGNGRVARAVGDLMLSRADGEPYRYYSVSSQIQAERDDYYSILERTQRDGLDVTPWLVWFLDCLLRAVRHSDAELDRVLVKAMFWQRMAHVPLSERQVKALNKVLDEFGQPLTNRKWAALTRTSSDTALRDLRALVEAGVLERTDAGGRSAAYWLVGVPMPVGERESR